MTDEFMAKPQPGTWKQFNKLHVLYFGLFRATLFEDEWLPLTWWLRCPSLVLGSDQIVVNPGEGLVHAKQRAVQLLHTRLVEANEDLRKVVND